MENFAEWVKEFTKSTTGKIIAYIFTERVITGLSRVLDAWMIYLISSDVEFGIYKAFFYVTPLYAMLCVTAVYTIDFFSEKGTDISGMEELRKIENEKYKKRQLFKRALQWVLSRKKAIFLIGSWWQIDPTYVTILLRNKSNGFWRNSFFITAPSVLLTMFVHTFIWWCAVKGFNWAMWFVS